MIYINRDPEELSIDQLIEHVFELRDFIKDTRAGEADIIAQTNGLTPSERELLRALMDRHGNVASFGYLYERIGEAGNRLLRVWICNLRKKLADEGVEIKSHFGVGYSLTFTEGETP